MNVEPNPNSNPRIIVIQKLYGYYLNKSSSIEIQKHRYKKFIRDTVSGTIEREELLLENLKTIKSIPKKIADSYGQQE